MTDTDTITEADDTPVPTHNPSADYDGARTPSEVNVRYREIWADMIEVYGDKYAVPRDVRHRLQEDMRRAHERCVYRKGKRGSSTPRAAAAPVVLQPEETEDGLVITCQGPCGETKPFKKFPTRSGGKPGREGICRECRDARIAATKKGS